MNQRRLHIGWHLRLIAKPRLTVNVHHLTTIISQIIAVFALVEPDKARFDTARNRVATHATHARVGLTWIVMQHERIG